MLFRGDPKWIEFIYKRTFVLMLLPVFPSLFPFIVERLDGSAPLRDLSLSSTVVCALQGNFSLKRTSTRLQRLRKHLEICPIDYICVCVSTRLTCNERAAK